MKDYDDHTHRTGFPALVTAPNLSNAELLERADVLSHRIEHLGLWLDFNASIGMTTPGLECAIPMEHERTRRPGHPSTWEPGYHYAKDEKHAVRVLINRTVKAKEIAEELGLVINITGKAYHDEI